ncbi:hypothetical protein GCM10027445_46080 [Amycolatopsis endophytica]|uniref:Peptidase inhibitor family I36 n=1 Tax=Amycolatopsis endophytica TaxID=860233 RepID=A0A853BCR8_9PSEU|nr:peptidase inhibitor family I36 protein [Amycolatopsis endophytica]NYI92575.1 hypothetical protein [Amycolatopsis endophytica]
MLSTGIAGAAALAAITLTTTPAQAADGYYRCPPSHLCLFTGPDGTGAIATFQVGSPDLRQQGVDANVASVMNLTAKGVCGWSEPGYTGETLIAWPGTHGQGTNLGDYARYRLSSVKVGC